MWTIEKFINPGNTAAVFQAFYGVEGLSSAISISIGLVQIIIVLAFTVGLQRTWAYGAILLMHAVSTAVSFSLYIDPWAGSNLLFFAAFPMLAARIALYILRANDTYSVDGQRASA